MKKLLFSALALFVFGFANAQMKFGVKAGFTAQSYSIKSVSGYYGLSGASYSSSESGFFAGAFLDIPLADKWQFHPEAEFVVIDNFNSISAPLLVKYMIIDNLNVMAGPGLNYYLDANDEEFKVSGDIGASYDFTEHFGADLRYDIGVMGDTKVSGLYVGAYYRF
jgi:hypothetical protein